MYGINLENFSQTDTKQLEDKCEELFNSKYSNVTKLKEDKLSDTLGNYMVASRIKGLDDLDNSLIDAVDNLYKQAIAYITKETEIFYKAFNVTTVDYIDSDIGFYIDLNFYVETKI